MKPRIITISREYGSGGREIGRKVAQALGIDFYDKELISEAAKVSGLDENLIREVEETRAALPFFNLPTLSQTSGDGYAAPLNVQDQAYLAESQAIRAAADKGPCLIVGRAADYVLAGRADCLNVFVYAGLDVRIKRVMERAGADEAGAKKTISRVDRSRAAYYHYYTGQEWGLAKNYHVALDSGYLGTEGCVKAIVGIAQEE